jgi:hypothetical protein
VVYKFIIDFHFLNEFKTVKDLQAFMDELRTLLESHDIHSYQNVAEQDVTIKTETSFKQVCPNVECMRKFLDDMRKFLEDKKIKKYKYSYTSEYVKPGL